MDAVHARLTATVPAQSRTSIVHGDYRIDNVILGEDGAVRAVLDWELCTLGDPLADLGLVLVYWTEPGEDATPRLTGTTTSVEGFPTRAELVARYVGRTGADVSRLDYFRALGSWKLACITEGVYARYRAGALGGGDDGLDLDLLPLQVEALAEAALALTDAPAVPAA
jgi:aminoglycoside phosphotransferase (APT) family kinase protein